MSIKLDIEELTDEQRDIINKDLQIRVESKMTSMPKIFLAYHYLNDDIYIPFAYAVNELKRSRRKRKEFLSADFNFEGTLRDEQKILKEEAISFLNKTGSIIISAFTGFGKTLCAINLASVIKLKTLIIVNKVVLINQWKKSIEQFCPDAVVQKLTPKSVFNGGADFYIMNAINIPKMSKTYFQSIGLVICDEIHLLMAETVSRSLHYVCPRYLIGLSATPFRPDGMDILLELYFGKNKIIRTLKRKHTVYQVDTGLKIPMELGDNGKVNWGAILKIQSEDLDRNMLIVSIIQTYKDRNFLVLTKRVEQGKFLLKELLESGESVTSLLGSEQTFNLEARILVATTQKCSTGFDHPKMDTLLLCSDIQEYYIQALGRIFRRRDTEPIVFDLVDNNPILFNHYKTRQDVYREVGGVIKKFKLS